MPRRSWRGCAAARRFFKAASPGRASCGQCRTSPSRSTTPSRAPRGAPPCCRAPPSSPISIALPRMTTKPADPGLHGWLVIDKPEGVTSVRIVAQIKRATGAKTGHAGTLDPLATGVLPLALGEATKTVRFAAAGHKRYRFRIRWGIARDTVDREGAVIAEAPVRPDTAAMEAAIPGFTTT